MRPFPACRFRRLAAAACALAAVALPVKSWAAAPAATGNLAAQAMSLLRQECLTCHNEAKKKGGLVLSARDLALRGGDNGPVLLPGRASQSPMVAVLSSEADPHMPPKKQLPKEAISLLAAWIDNDAPWDEALLQASSDASRARLADLRALPSPYAPSYALALSPDRSWLAAGRGASIRLLNTTNSETAMSRQWNAHPDVVQSLAWRPGRAELASGGYREIVLWSDQGERLLTYTNLLGRVTALCFAPDGMTLAAADSDPSQGGLLAFFDLSKEPAQVTHVPAHADAIYDLDIAKDGRWLATAGGDRWVKVWDLERREEVGRLEGHLGQILGVAFNDDGSLLATASSDQEIKIWDRASGEQRRTVKRLSSPPCGLVWLSDGPRLLAIGQDGRLSLIHSEREQPERNLDSVGESLHALAAPPDGSAAYAAGASGAIFVWERPLNRTQWRRWPDAEPESP